MKNLVFAGYVTCTLQLVLFAVTFAVDLNGQNLGPDEIRRLQSLSPSERTELIQRLQNPGAPKTPVVEENIDPGEGNVGEKEEFDREEKQHEKDSAVALIGYELELEVDLFRLEEILKSLKSNEADRRMLLEKRLKRIKSLLDKVRSLQLSEMERRVEEIEKPSEPELKMFGHELFTGSPSTFAPVDDAPVPPDYVVGPGDLVEVQIFGKENHQYVLAINRDGRIQFPDIGPINVFERGTDFQSLKILLRAKILESYGEGVQASISMGPLRSVRIFLLGDVTRPGSYVVSSLSTITNALFAGGGISKVGSMRNVHLKRKGELVGQFDLYDLLLKGDTSGDLQVQPGDVIFAPPVGSVVGVGGAVRRPALYELKGEKELGELLDLAGGLLPSSLVNLCRVERIGDSGQREVVNVDLGEPQGLAFSLRNGDLVKVYSSLDKIQKIVSFHGHIERPGEFQWLPGVRLSDLVPDKAALLEKPDLDYALIRREDPETGMISVTTVHPRLVFASPGTSIDPELQPRDQVIFFGTEDIESRRELVGALIEELRTQTRPGAKALVVSVTGPVHFPGEYPLSDGMRVADLIRAGGNMKDDAYVLSAELTRYSYDKDGEVSIDHVTIQSLSELEENAERDLALEPYDNLRIKPLPDWAERGVVFINGEVRFPGVYPIRRGEALADVLKRAGGLTDRAFAGGAVFLRQSLKEKEETRKEELTTRLEADLALLAVEKSTTGDALQAGSLAQSLLAQLGKTEAVGRMVIDFSAIVEGGGEQPLILEAGDKLIVPLHPQEVMVVGEVQYPTSHLYKKRLGMKDYVGLSGGFTYKADRKRVFVVKADGSVGNTAGSSWFPLNSSGISPGDSVVVPLDADRGQALKRIGNITQIVYQMALAAAAVNSF